MATKQVKGDWKITNRGRYRFNRGVELRMKSRKTGEWCIAHRWHDNKLSIYQWVPETVTRVVMRRRPVTIDEVPEEVKREILLWKMSQK